MQFSKIEVDATSFLGKDERRLMLKKRAISRFFAGSGYERLLLVTLTTPEGFEGDIHRAWRLFVFRLRKRGLFRRYFAVREWNEAKTCIHLHVVFQTRSELDAQALRSQWQLATKSEFCWTKHEWARDKGKMGAYLAKYLTKALEGHRSYWYSSWWVFSGFARWSKGLWALGVERAERLAWKVRAGQEKPEAAIVCYIDLLTKASVCDKLYVRSVRAIECSLERYKGWEKVYGR